MTRRKWDVSIKIRVGFMGLYRICLAQDKNQWPAFVNTVMNIRFL
jgi:hypothetical protein